LLYNLFLEAVQHHGCDLQHLGRIDHGGASHDLLTSCVRHTYLAGPSANFDWFLLRNPELISIPSGFLYGFVGTLISKEPHPAERYDELSVRAFSGAGAEKAVVHQEHLTSPGVKFPVTRRIAPP
jgi:hypothetical protein